MNYKWETVEDRGQYENGHVEIFRATINGLIAIAIINYLPQFEGKDEDQKLVTTLLLEGNKVEWTEGIVKSILYDCEDRIRNVSNFYFRIFNSLEYMTTQTFYFKDLKGFEFGKSGDLSFETPIN